MEGASDEEGTQERGEREVCVRAGDGGRVEYERAPLGRNRWRHRERVRLPVRGLAQATSVLASGRDGEGWARKIVARNAACRLGLKNPGDARWVSKN